MDTVPTDPLKLVGTSISLNMDHFFFKRIYLASELMRAGVAFGSFFMMSLLPLFFFAVSQFETEFYISGLAPLCDQLVVLSYVKELSDKTVIIFSSVAEELGGWFVITP